MPGDETYFLNIFSDDAKYLQYTNGFTPSLKVNLSDDAEVPQLVLKLS